MMYVSAFPVTMTIRNTNVYEERSLGIFADGSEPDPGNQTTATGDGITGGLRRTSTMAHGETKRGNSTWAFQHFVRQQLRIQLGHDI